MEINNGDRFGTSVSLDNERLAIGAPNVVSVSGPFRGAVYVYKLNNDDPPQYDSAYQIIARHLSGGGDDSANNDFFGRSVSIHGNHLIVGAPGKNSNDGAVYVYEKSGGIWNMVHYCQINYKFIINNRRILVQVYHILAIGLLLVLPILLQIQVKYTSMI